MYEMETNEKIGKYLSKLIADKYDSTREFCREYIRMRDNTDVISDEELNNLANRVSQIKTGKKAIQGYDLLRFAQLLEVTCEEILTAGNYKIIDSKRMTLYKLAFCKEIDVWKKYIDREDGMILKCDEYGKTVIDYAMEFKNYEILKYLVEKGYIWFVEERHNQCGEVSFWGGTSINPIKNQIILPAELLGDELRQKMIVLACENDDIVMLERTKARQIPGIYYGGYSVDYRTCFNENIINAVAESGPLIIRYFSEEYDIDAPYGVDGPYIFPYIDKLYEAMVKNRSKNKTILLKNILKHNKNVYHSLVDIIDKSISIYQAKHSYMEAEENREIAINLIHNGFNYSDNGNIVRLLNYIGGESFKTNIIKLELNSNDNKLVEEINDWFDKVKNIANQYLSKEE